MQRRSTCRYGPVKRLRVWEQLHNEVASFFSCGVLFWLYSFFAEAVNQHDIPSNYYVRDAVDLFLFWIVSYPPSRTLSERHDIPWSVLHRIFKWLAIHSTGLADVWITMGTLGMLVWFLFCNSEPSLQKKERTSPNSSSQDSFNTVPLSLMEPIVQWGCIQQEGRRKKSTTLLKSKPLLWTLR